MHSISSGTGSSLHQVFNLQIRLWAWRWSDANRLVRKLQHMYNVSARSSKRKQTTGGNRMLLERCQDLIHACTLNACLPKQTRCGSNLDVQGVRIHFRIDGDSQQPKLPASTNDTNSNLAAIGDEDLMKCHWRCRRSPLSSRNYYPVCSQVGCPCQELAPLQL